MASEIEVFKEVASSDIPKGSKTVVQRLIDRATRGKGSDWLAKHGGKIRSDHVQATINNVRQIGESALTGAGLAYVDVHVGLDINKIPVDGVVAGLAAAGSIATGGSEVSKDLGNIASAAATVYAFRATHRLLAEKKLAAHKPTSAKITGEDPILAAGKGLG